MFRSFRSALMLIIIAAAVMPALLLSIPLVNKIYLITSNAAVNELNLRARNVASTLNHEMDLLITRLVALGNNRDMILAAQSSLFAYQAGTYMEEFVRDNPLVTGIYLLDDSPFIVEAVPRSIEGLDPQPLLGQIQATLVKPSALIKSNYIVSEFDDATYLNQLFHFVAKGNKDTATASAPAVRTISSSYGIGIIIPLRQSTNRGDNTFTTKGFLVAIIPIEKLAAIASPNLQTSTRMEFLLAEQNLIKSTSPIEGSTSDIATEVPLRVTTAGLYYEFRFRLRLIEPDSVRFAEATSTLKRLIAWVTCTVLVVLVLAYKIARWLTAPLGKLTDTVHHYASGDYHPTLPQMAFSEFRGFLTVLGLMGAKITAQLNELTDTNTKLVRAQEHLERTNERLEDQVKQRTSQLEDAITQLSVRHKELQEMQVQLVQNEKMSSLGTLVAGVAHEINNPANFANVGAENLEVDLQGFQQTLFHLAGDDADTEVKKFLSDKFSNLFNQVRIIRDGISRIKMIVTDLRTFSRPDDAKQDRISLAHAISSTLNLVRGTYNKNVEFVCDFQSHTEISCWPTQLNQVFMNIVVNGSQAIIKRQQDTGDFRRGVLTIRTFERDNHWVTIQFEDSGTGIAPEHLKQIFEPFFTTKPIGEGTGLGLSITFGIIQKHKGKVEVSSQLGKGTTFTILLPIHGAASVKDG
jgi:signal transduction histidine kinase